VTLDSLADASLTDRVRAAVGTVVDPELRRPLGELGMIGAVDVSSDSTVNVEVKLTVTGCPAAAAIERDVIAAALSVDGLTDARVTLNVMTDEERLTLRESLRPGARTNPFGPGTLTRVIAIASGKGGVGKSSVTVNLAAELAHRGFAVGIIDADVYGFSVPALMGLTPDGVAVRPIRIDDMIVPPVAHDVKVLSIGMFVEDHDVAVAWRGPMLQRTITQFLSDAWFGALDFLLLDLPPGTGDVAITVGQLLPNAEIVLVTTPQASASDVAVRAGSLARQLGQHLLGVVENMSDSEQPDGTTLSMFGTGGALRTAEKLESSVIATVPLSMTLRMDADAGIPVVLAHPDDPASLAVRELADAVVRRPEGLRGLTVERSGR
jgi:ATP-binding protein involved in chromosome partitioning